MPATTRELRWTDMDELVAAYFLLYEERAAGAPVGITLLHERPTREAEIAWFVELYRRVLEGTTLARIAEVDGHAVGSCTVAPAGAGTDSEGGHVGVLGLLIHRDHRNRGLGRTLLTDMIDRCRAKFEVIRLSVFSDNAPAIHLYERQGFRRCGHLPRAVRRGSAYFDVDEMVLVL
jgi:ribosomal protein S18 acetylase RimI-like enzyme